LYRFDLKKNARGEDADFTEPAAKRRGKAHLAPDVNVF
jgi:hypothetical protein